MILDTNNSTLGHLSTLKQLGYTHLIRYIATGSKSITPYEARAIAAAGILLATVYEGWGDTKGEFTGALGTAHALEYLHKAPPIGQPPGSAMWFAVDNDESAASIRDRILPYFESIRQVVGAQYRVGVYGSGNVCAAALDAGFADLAWLSNASGWAGFQSFKASGRWSLLQHVPKTIAGLDTDPDEINPGRPDIGAFVPFGAVAPGVSTPAPTAPVFVLPTIEEQKRLQTKLQTAGLYAGNLDGDIGPQSIRAMIAYVEKHEPAA